MRALYAHPLQRFVRPGPAPLRCPVLVHRNPRKSFLTHAVEVGPQPAPEEEPIEPPKELAVRAPTLDELLYIDPALEEELQLLELEQAQEDILKWLSLDEQTQNEDLDEMIDYDEFGDEEYADLHDELEQLYEVVTYDQRIGDRVMGRVIEIEDDGAYVDIGGKALAFCPVTVCAFARLKTPLEAVRVGMEREFILIGSEDWYGMPIVSLAAMEASTFWARIQQLQDEQVSVTVTVESVNRGGLLVKYGPYDGFIPMSQFGQAITPASMESLIGRELQVRFMQVEEETERLVFTHKGAAGGPAVQLVVGDVVSGVVQSVKPYGAFIDLGRGVMGLLHVSQVTHDRVMVVDKIFKEGDQVKVMVLSVDPERNRVALSTKKLEPTPGDMLRDPQLVYDNADAMAAAFRERLAAAAAEGAAAAAGLTGLEGPDPQQYAF